MQRDLAEDDPTVEHTRLDGYVLRERIGEGGMGVVHRATDERGRVVAVKLLRPHVAGDADSRARFAREAQVLARVRGRHVAQVLDADVAAATPYLVTDFVAGPPLHEVVDRDGPLEGADLADLAGDLADALCSIHSAGVVHRDLKPGNVLLEGGLAVVIDFGIAQIADETRMTMPGLVYGTPGYVAPELLTGEEVTPAADIHSWAATVAYAATGRTPFGKGPLEAVAYRVLHEDPDLAGCPDWLAPVLSMCLAKDPSHRPRAAELLRWLETGEPPPAVATALAAEHPNAGDPYDSAEAAATARLAVPGVDERPDRYADHDWDQEDGSPTQIGNGQVAPADDYPTQVGAGDDYPTQSVDDYPTETADGYAGEADDAEPDGDADRQWPAYLHPGRQHRVVTALLFGTLTALAAVLPTVAAIGAAGWLLLARTVDLSALFVGRRRSLRGRRALDPVATAAALPWHLLRSTLVTALTLPIAAVGAGILVGIAVLFFYVGAISPRWDVVCGAAALVVAGLAWWGVEGESVQRGSERILTRLLSRRWAAIAAGAVLVLACLLLATVASTEPISWWPVSNVPWSSLDWRG